jgi:PAS domain S-box-containing protein
MAAIIGEPRHSVNKAARKIRAKSAASIACRINGGVPAGPGSIPRYYGRPESGNASYPGLALSGLRVGFRRKGFAVNDQAGSDFQTQEFLLQGIAESIAAPIVFLTPDGGIEIINQHLLDFFGKTREEMEGWQSSEIIHPDDRKATIDALRQAIKTGQPYEVEARRRRVDGVYRWWRSNGYPMRDSEGRIIRWCVLYTDIHDRKLAEDAVQTHEFLLRSMIDSVLTPVSIWKPTGEPDLVNRLAREYFGRSIRTVEDWIEIVHPDDHTDGFARWQSALTMGTAYYEEVRLLRADGVYRWHDVRNFPMRDSEGAIVRWCVIQIDIHDRKRIEQALAASEQRLEQIINTIPAMAWSANPDGSCDFFNKHHLEYVGRDLKDMQGFSFVSTFHPDDIGSLMGAWQAMLESGRSGEVEGRIRRSDGEYRWCLFRTNPLHDAEGRLVKWFGVNIDIEDRKRAEEMLRGSERNFRGLTESIPQMLWRTTPDGLVDYGNSRFLEYTGYTAEEVMGIGWLKILHPDDLERTQRVWDRAVTTGEPYHIEYRVRRAADNTYRWCLVTALPLRDEDGSIMKWHGCCIDVHDWKLAQDELRETQAELAHVTRVMTMGQLTASIAHELNQPLSGIMTNAGTGMRMLSADPPNVQGAKETVRRTIRDAQRASDVITRLRALFARKPATAEIVDINDAIREVIALASNEFRRKGIAVQASLDSRLPTFMGDRVQLQQVILNLMLNGAEAMDAVRDRPRELAIATILEATGEIRVSIKDLGTGFDTATVDSLFTPFFTTKGGGMGIGLSVSRTIVEHHKGRIWAENNDGPGATFCFSIPSREVEPDA